MSLIPHLILSCFRGCCPPCCSNNRSRLDLCLDRAEIMIREQIQVQASLQNARIEQERYLNNLPLHERVQVAVGNLLMIMEDES